MLKIEFVNYFVVVLFIFIIHLYVLDKQTCKSCVEE
nr:MAG TPA: hypothetical protein [Caudoviricetes sp.]